MKIEPSLAQNIVVSMKEIINQEINFINTDSIIIASTDKSRIGKSHGGAQEVMQTKGNVIINYDGQYEGTKKGINIPIYTDLNLVGVIGITGNKDEVEKYGEIIKNMTEILIKDAWLKDVSFKKRENYRIFMEELIADSEDTENIYHLANILEINLGLPRVAVIGYIKDFSSIKDEHMESLKNMIDLILATDDQNIFNFNGSEIRIIFNANSGLKNIQHQLRTIMNNAQEKFDLLIYLGMGTMCEDMKTFKNSYKQALTALDWALVNSENQIEYYDKMDLGLILTNLTTEAEEQFTHKILRHLSEEELEEYNVILSFYGKQNGSNYKTAENLFIHKNTLQYKLIKLHKITGYDPRVLDDYVILSLAFKLRNIQKTKKSYKLFK